MIEKADGLDTLKKVQSLLGRTKAALPEMQDKAIETGDFSEIDKASALIDRLVAASENISNQQAKPQQEGPAMADAGSGATITRDKSASLVPAAPPPALPSGPPVDPMAEVVKADRMKRLAELDAPVKEAQQANLPVAVKRNRQALESAAATLNNGAVGSFDPKGDVKEFLSRLDAVPVPPGREQQTQEVRRLAGSILKDEEAIIRMAPKLTPDALARQNFMDLRKSGALGPAEIREGKVAGPSPAALLPSSTPDVETPREGEPGEAEAVANTDKPADIPGLALKADADFKGNPKAVMDDILKAADKSDASEREKAFARRVAMEIGQRPKKFTIEKLLIALTNGAGAVLGAWATGRYGGQALIDMDADQRAYDARKAQIGSEVYGAHEARARQEESIASRERIAEASRKQRESEGVARDKVARFNAKVRALSVQNAQGARQMNMLGKAILERMDSERLKIRSASDQAAGGMMKPAEYLRIQNEAALRLEQLAADLESLASGGAGG